MVGQQAPPPDSCEAEYRRVLQAVRDAGLSVDDLGGLGGPSEPDYRIAIPILLKELGILRCHDNYSWVLHLVVNGIALRQCGREAMPALIEQFRRDDLPTEMQTQEGLARLRAQIADGIRRLASPADADDILVLASDRAYGFARAPLVEALSKLRCPERTLPLLLESLSDASPVVVASAVRALARMKAVETLDEIEPLTENDNPLVRERARQAVKLLVANRGGEREMRR